MTILLSIFVIAVLLIFPVSLFVRSSGRKQLKITIYVFALVITVRIVTQVWYSRCFGSDLNIFENMAGGIISALQTFSLDEDYSSSLIMGKELLASYGWDSASGAYGIVVSVLNVCAPVSCGALLIEILTNVFPRLKIALRGRSHKFVFSQLNEKAVTLAQDIADDDHYKDCYPKEQFKKHYLKPLIIFTGANKNEASESMSELFERAKAIGAVCTSTDLLHLKLRRSRSVSYLLLDDDQNENVRALSRLLKPDKNEKTLWPKPKKNEEPDSQNSAAEPVTRIFVFVQDDAYSRAARHICKKISRQPKTQRYGSFAII